MLSLTFTRISGCIWMTWKDVDNKRVSVRVHCTANKMLAVQLPLFPDCFSYSFLFFYLLLFLLPSLFITWHFPCWPKSETELQFSLFSSRHEEKGSHILLLEHLENGFFWMFILFSFLSFLLCIRLLTFRFLLIWWQTYACSLFLPQSFLKCLKEKWKNERERFERGQ